MYRCKHLDEKLPTETFREGCYSFHFLCLPVVVLSMGANLFYQASKLASRCIFKIGCLDLTSEDVLSSDLQLVVFNEIPEGNRCLHADEARKDTVEVTGDLVTSELLRSKVHMNQRIRQAVPRRRSWDNSTRLNRSRVDTPVYRLLLDELYKDLIKAGFLSPVGPVSDRRFNITNPESTQ